jgi:site-specific recombinase XerC
MVCERPDVLRGEQHGQRQTATFLIEVLKYPPTVVQLLLGHSDISTTLGIYTHTDLSMLQSMMDDLDGRFGGHS